jgi:hypothetical protein
MAIEASTPEVRARIAIEVTSVFGVRVSKKGVAMAVKTAGSMASGVDESSLSDLRATRWPA